MKNIWLKILLVVLMLIPIPFSCKDMNDCPDLYVEPYYSAQAMHFHYVDKYWINQKTKPATIKFDIISQDYENMIYAADSLAMFFHTPDTQLLYHSQNKINKGFSLSQELFACNRSGWAGTKDLVDKIYISSNYDYDETHGRNYDLSDIVQIFAYTSTGKNKWMLLSDYNENSPYEASKRFYLLMTRKPTISKTQQFVVKYYMKNEPGMPSKYFIMETPVFQLR